MIGKELNTGEPVALMFVLDGCRCVTLYEDASHEIRHNGTPLYSQDYVNQLLGEIAKLKAFVQPILVHGDAGIGDWDGLAIQDLAVEAGLLNQVTRTEPCNLGKEETQACACREICYDEKGWECYRIADFLLD